MIRFLLAFCTVLLVQGAFAHDLDLTLVKVMREKGSTRLEVSTPLSRFVRTAGLGDHPSGAALDWAVRERLMIGTQAAAALQVDSQADLLTWSVALPKDAEVSSERFDDSTPAARTIIATYEDGELRSEQVLDAHAATPSLWGMLQTGIGHILSGLDHILFVVGLALLAGGWKATLKILSVFTLAHSITLAGAALGWVHVNPKIVEPLIALSIVALAVEGLRPEKAPETPHLAVRLGIAFGFGLVHGLGFAGGLNDLGLRGPALVGNLAAFSAGIELGQLAILTLTLALMAGLAKLNQERAPLLARAASVGLGMIGCFWFVERIL